MAKKDEIVQGLRAMLPDGAVSVDEAYRTGVGFTAQVPLGSLREVAQEFDRAEFYLESLTCIEFQDTFELVYHFNCYEPKSRVAMRVLFPEGEAPATLSDIFASANWQEREVHEFFGVRFANHPDLRPLLLPEDSVEHPLRKTVGNVIAYRKREEIYG